jgi:hypothetical protein
MNNVDANKLHILSQQHLHYPLYPWSLDTGWEGKSKRRFFANKNNIINKKILNRKTYLVKKTSRLWDVLSTTMCMIKENNQVKIISFEFQIRQCVFFPYPKLEGASVDTKFGSTQMYVIFIQYYTNHIDN